MRPRVSLYRKAQGLKQSDLCRLAHLSPGTIVTAEKTGHVTASTKNKISKALKVPVCDLFPCDEAPIPETPAPEVRLEART